MSEVAAWAFVALSICMALGSLGAYLNARRQIKRIEHAGRLSLELSDRVKEIARDSARKVEAIKVHREESGAGLAEAKEAIEAYQYLRCGLTAYRPRRHARGRKRNAFGVSKLS